MFPLPITVDVQRDEALAVKAERVGCVIADGDDLAVLRDIARAAGDRGHPRHGKPQAERALAGFAVVGDRERRLHSGSPRRHGERQRVDRLAGAGYREGAGNGSGRDAGGGSARSGGNGSGPSPGSGHSGMAGGNSTSHAADARPNSGRGGESVQATSPPSSWRVYQTRTPGRKPSSPRSRAKYREQDRGSARADLIPREQALASVGATSIRRKHPLHGGKGPSITPDQDRATAGGGLILRDRGRHAALATSITRDQGRVTGGATLITQDQAPFSARAFVIRPLAAPDGARDRPAILSTSTRRRLPLLPHQRTSSPMR